MPDVTGLHHITAICGDPQENLDFYAGVLGMRLVKRSVNQDVPGTYHLFYADAVGQPGSDLTFFPWPHLRPGRQGLGLATEVSLAVPTGSLAFWAERLERFGTVPRPVTTRFDELVMPFEDPHGLPIALVETADDRDFTPWGDSPIDVSHQVRRLHGVRMDVADVSASATFLKETFDFREVGTESGWLRLGAAAGMRASTVAGPGAEEAFGGSGRVVDLRSDPESPRGLQGVGTVHHVAWRVSDTEVLAQVRNRVMHAGRGPTPVIDRFWFQSVYFQEPGSVLFELATDGPGFAVDEDQAQLGEQLILPPWLEEQREAIEQRLPPLTPADPSRLSAATRPAPSSE